MRIADAHTRAERPSQRRPITVVYLAYGPRRLVRAAAFSALTFLHVARALTRPWRLTIYTDQAEAFRSHGIEAHFVPVEVLREDGDAAYLHRLKILAVDHAARTTEGDVFYLDGDTYFTSSPAHLFDSLSATQAIMHKREWKLGEDVRPELDEIIRSHDFSSPVLRWAQQLPELTMWNAGALGIAEVNKPLIGDVLAVSDQLNAVYRSHVAEQLAWVLVLSRAADLVPADDVLYHYWFAQEELTHRTVTFLRRNAGLPAAELAARAYALGATATEGWKPPVSVRARVAARSVKRRLRAAVT